MLRYKAGIGLNIAGFPEIPDQTKILEFDDNATRGEVLRDLEFAIDELIADVIERYWFLVDENGEEI